MKTDNMMDQHETSEDLLKKIEKRKRLEKEQANIGWYYWLISEYPGLVIFLCSVIIIVFTAVGIAYTDHPDFSDPSKGFEVRGTDLADKLVTWHNLLNKTGYNQTLSNYPYVYAKRKAEMAQINYKKPRWRKKHKKKKKKDGKKKRTRRSTDDRRTLAYTWDFQQDGYFCDNPKSIYAKWSVELDDDSITSLWSVEALQSMCAKEKQLLNHPKYPDFCVHQSLASCCPVMSLPNYIAYVASLNACENITESSLVKVERILRTCSLYYCQNELTSYCWQSDDRDSNCPNIPKKCTNYNAVHTIFHYLMERSVVCPWPQNISLQRSTVFAPIHMRSNLLPIYYDNFGQHQLTDGITRISAINFGLNDDVFEDLLYSDTVFPLCAMAAVSLIILLYTKSIFITFMSFLSTTSAMFMSYFLYTIVLDFKYFPFLNLTALLVMVGMSADNVLVFHSAWCNYADDDERDLYQSIKPKHHPIPSRVGAVTKATMRHVAWSLFVTGFTTAAAFLSNYSSQVTAIKCFGMYTGLTVLANLFLSLTWLPAAIVFHHKHFSFTYTDILKLILCKHFGIVTDYLAGLCEGVSELTRVFFHQIQVLLVVRMRYLWAILYLMLSVASFYVVVVNPGFKLPSTSTYFQFFRSSHPFEVYTREEGKYFAFQNQSIEYLPVRVIFGVLPSDLGDQRDPTDTGSLKLQHRFNVSSPRSQIWLLNFCKTMRNTTYYRPVDQDQSFSMCFIETFKNWMGRECTKNSECCQRRSFPFPSLLFEHCLKEAIFQLTITPGIRLQSWTPGPRYDSKDKIRAIIVEFSSTQKYSSSYEEIGKFYEDVETFLAPQLETAPFGLANGWFISDLEFYSLQSGLHSGTIASVGWSLLVALIVILFTTRNLLVSILANATIAGIIFVTAASLVLMGWELNVLESITISIAVGLSVDFTAHYAIAYIVALPNNDRQQRVEFAVTRMGPAITLAALTTFLAGAGMMPASVLAYTRFGVFLMVIMAVSWVYSTYFFLASLSIVGPQGHYCDFRCRCDDVVEDDEHTTVMTETSSHTPPTCNNEVIERATVI